MLQLILNKKCDNIIVQDASKFINKPCMPYTILYQLSNIRNGMYESIGFQSDPPLETDNIQQLLDGSYEDFNNHEISTKSLITDSSKYKVSTKIPKNNTIVDKEVSPEEIKEEPPELTQMVEVVKSYHPNIPDNEIKIMLKTYHYDIVDTLMEYDE